MIYKMWSVFHSIMMCFHRSFPAVYVIASDPSLSKVILTFVQNYYGSNIRSEREIYSRTRMLKQLPTNVIDYHVANPNLCEDDLKIFGAFKNSNDLIIDVGANWGYSALDIWSVGANCKIISFEPVKFFSPLLKRISQLNKGRYDFRIMGLSDSVSVLNFTVPVVNDYPIYALSSANESPEVEILSKNIFNHIKQYLSFLSVIKLKMHQFQCRVDTLDNQLENEFFGFFWERVAAIKIDVEGLEFRVIKGAICTLQKYKPLIMLEGGNRWPGIQNLMTDLGYRFAERENNFLVVCDGFGKNVNGYFIHVDQFDLYKAMGILK